MHLVVNRCIAVTDICPSVFEATNELHGVRDFLNFRYYEDVIPQQRSDKQFGSMWGIREGTEWRG